jgi:hypothetical protein
MTMQSDNPANPGIYFDRRLILDAAITACIAIMIGASWLLVSDGGLADLAPIRLYYFNILTFGYIVLLLPSISRARPALSLASAAAIIALTLWLIMDLTTVRFFDAPFVVIYPFLPMSAGATTLETVTGVVTSYVPATLAMLAAFCVIFCFGLANFLESRSRARVVMISFVPLLFVGSYLGGATMRDLDKRIAALMDEPPPTPGSLFASDRTGNFSLEEAPLYEPKTIVFVIMESTGSSIPSSDGQLSLGTKIRRMAGDQTWIEFANAATASNATDIAVPSMMTGSGSHEPIGKLHSLPFLSDLAAARGYHTVFATSATLQWAGFNEFFAKGSIDRFVSADDTDLPFVNDLAIDDEVTFRAAADRIASADGKLFLTVYPHSLHYPFQEHSAFHIPDDIGDRRSRATYIQEAGFEMLFDALRKSGRLDDALIIALGDHGEFDYSSELRLPQVRVETFDHGVLSPLFLVKLPADLPANSLAALKNNADRLVSGIDIAPTFADMLGARLENDLDYTGYSLLGEVPHDRVVYATSTNEWRVWNKSAAAIARGNERLICDTSDLCKLYRVNALESDFEGYATPDDELFRLALAEPLIRKAIAQIYRYRFQ